jgi:hypothetical protein
MSRRKFTVDRYNEIERLLAAGRGVREIARSLKCSRRTVREIRDRQRHSPDEPRVSIDPLWMTQISWPQIVHDLGLGHPLKFLWEEKAQGLTTYSNTWTPLRCQAASSVPAHRSRLQQYIRPRLAAHGRGP